MYGLPLAWVPKRFAMSGDNPIGDGNDLGVAPARAGARHVGQEALVASQLVHQLLPGLAVAEDLELPR